MVMRRVRRAHAPAMAQPIRCWSQWTPFWKKCGLTVTDLQGTDTDLVPERGLVDGRVVLGTGCDHGVLKWTSEKGVSLLIEGRKNWPTRWRSPNHTKPPFSCKRWKEYYFDPAGRAVGRSVAAGKDVRPPGSTLPNPSFVINLRHDMPCESQEMKLTWMSRVAPWRVRHNNQ